jgi:hypothetical protein
VGNWKEIDAKECCNYVAPTTTSTTTVAPTTTTSTTIAPTTTTSTTVAPTTTTTTTENLECLNFEIQVVTSSEITMVDCDGLVIPFTITGPVTETYCARSISGTGDVTITELGPCVPITTTTTTTIGGYVTWEMAASNVSSEDACNGGSGLVTLYSATSPLNNSMFLYTDTALSIPAPALYYANPSSNIVYVMDGGFGAGFIFSQALCSSITTTTTTTEFPGYYTWLMGRGTDTTVACAATPVPVYSSVSPLNLGVFLYDNTALTTPVSPSWYAVGGVAYEVDITGEIITETLCPE